MKLVTLGAPRLDGPGATSSARRKQVALLTYLARQDNREATRTQLADMLWEEGDRARARHSLRQALSGLRPLLGNLLTTEGERVRLSGELPLDLTELELRAAERQEGDQEPEFLPGFEDVGGQRWRSWLQRERDAVRRRFRWRSGPAANRGKRIGTATRERRVMDEALEAAWEDIAPGGALIVDSAPDAMRATACERFAAARAIDSQLLAADATAPVTRPWGYLIRLCTRLPELEGLADAPASALAALRRFAPGLGNRFPRLPLRSTAAQDPAGALTETLAAVAEHGPLTVFMADFDRADAPSRTALAQLVRERPSNVSFVLVGSVADPIAGPELRSLARLPGAHLLPGPNSRAAEPEADSAPVPVVATVNERPTTADRMLLATGGTIALIVLVLALLASL